VTGEGEPILAKPHGLTFIPIAYYSPEGSTVYKKPERQILPMLYPVIQSGVWQRQSLFLTVTATNAAAMMNAQFVHNQGSADAKVTIDHSVIGEIVEVPPGSNLQPLAKEIINPGLVQQYQMYQELMDESTIFDQTLGQPIQGNTTFSLNALMNQAGRLPLSPIQTGMSQLFSEAMGIAFRWLKIDGKSAISAKPGEIVEIDPGKIPAALTFDVTVDVDMPTDKLQQANTAIAISGAGLASKEWNRTNILNIGQSDTEQSKIWREQMADQAAVTMFQPFLQQMMQKMGLMPQQPGQGGQVPPGQEQGPTPDQMAQMQQQQQGPTPEQMAQIQAMMQAQGGGQPMGEQGNQPGQPMPPVPPIPSGMMPGGM